MSKRRLNKAVIGSQYFIYFGVMGIFLPYFNLYCYHIGFSGSQIGILSGVRSIALIIFPLLWGALADRWDVRKPIYMFCNWVSTFVWCGFLLTTDFSLMVLVAFVYGSFYAPIISFLEAFTMDVLGREKKSYGRMRAWGSISFITMVIVLGAIIDAFSIDIIVSLILAGSLVQAIISFKIPAMTVIKKQLAIKDKKSLLHIKSIVFLTCAFLMLLSHGAYYGFFSIHLENLGYQGTFIGICWALASTAEILVMVNSRRIFKLFSFEKVLAFSFFIAALRWVVLGFAASGKVFLASQVLHSITYGAFHMAGILYMDTLAPKALKTTAQAINNAVTYGLGLTIGFFVSGAIYESSGARTLFLMSAGVALLGGIGFTGFHFFSRSGAKNSRHW